jgi:hypothetical protein
MVSQEKPMGTTWSGAFARSLECGCKFRDAFNTALDFDKEPSAGGNDGEGLIQRGDSFASPAGVFPSASIESLQFGQGLLAHEPFEPSRFAGVIVVDHYDLAIFGKLNIDFHGIGALLPTEPHGCEGIFGGIERSPSMGDDFCR